MWGGRDIYSLSLSLNERVDRSQRKGVRMYVCPRISYHMHFLDGRPKTCPGIGGLGRANGSRAVRSRIWILG